MLGKCNKLYSKVLLFYLRYAQHDMKKEIQLRDVDVDVDATQWFIELTIRSACFRHHYAHHQELETIQVFTACGT